MPPEFLEVISPQPGQMTKIEAFSEIQFAVKLDVEPWTDPKQVFVEVNQIMT
jgi:hypothetical protein